MGTKSMTVKTTEGGRGEAAKRPVSLFFTSGGFLLLGLV